MKIISLLIVGIRFFWQRAARIQDRRAIQARKARPARKAPKACTPLDYVGLQKEWPTHARRFWR